MPVGVPFSMICTSPESIAFTESALPLKGTCTMSTPAMRLNISMPRWKALPFPDEA